jgi:hypothetical protein
MRNAPFRNQVIGGLLLVSWGFSAVCQAPPRDQESGATLKPVPGGPLPVEQVVKRLQERNAQRTAALEQFQGTRVYRMQYRGFPSDRDAEMVVNLTYRAPDSKQFTVVSASGSRFIIDRVFKKLLESEQEASKEENRRRTALTSENYDFKLLGYETTSNGAQYVLDLVPRTRNKFLYRGKVWVDARDLAVVRMQGEPGKNPSFWIRKTEIEHHFVKVNDFWLPAGNHTESLMRLGGRAILSIEYKDYKIEKATPVHGIESAPGDAEIPPVADVR